MASISTLGYIVELVDLEGIHELNREFKILEKKYSPALIEKRAIEDASHNIPSLNHAGLAPFEQELLHATAELASKVATTYKGPLEVIDAKMKAEHVFLAQKQSDELERVESMYSLEKDAADNAFELKDAHKQLELAEKHYNGMYVTYNRAPIEYLPHWLYVILAIAIFLGEVPLNAMVFQIFGENQVMTWVMALIIGLCVPLTAHFVGIKFREHANGLSFGNTLKGLLAFAIVTYALFELSLLRQSYLGENMDALGLTEKLVHDSFMFFYLNLAVLSAAILIAYLSHDQVPGYQRARDELKAARKRVQRLEHRRVDQLKSGAMHRAEEKKNIHEAYRDGMNRVALLHGAYDQLLKEGQELERRCVSILRQLVSMYRRENLRARSDKVVPASFSVQPDLELELRTIAEKLNNEQNMLTAHPPTNGAAEL